MHLRFGETESAFDYMMATREYLEQHGKPLAFYSDKHGIFRVNNGGSTTTGVTQFGRVLSELGIELICANSPQAKGRVERANQTLQDRLIKEMRLEGISSIEAANAWLDTFITDFNRRFARPAKYPKDLHRPVAESNEELDDIFAWQEQRKLSKTLTFRYDKMIYLVEPTEENTRIAGEKITTYDYPDGTLAFKYGYRSLKYQVFDKLEWAAIRILSFLGQDLIAAPFSFDLTIIRTPILSNNSFPVIVFFVFLPAYHPNQAPDAPFNDYGCNHGYLLGNPHPLQIAFKQTYRGCMLKQCVFLQLNIMSTSGVIIRELWGFIECLLES